MTRFHGSPKAGENLISMMVLSMEGQNNSEFSEFISFGVYQHIRLMIHSDVKLALEGQPSSC